MLGPCEEEAVRACRYRVEGAQQDVGRHLADRFAAVQKFDAVFAAERSINGLLPAERLAARRKDVAPLVDDLIAWMTRERAKLSRHNDVAKAMDYMLKRVDAFTRFLDDGRICLTNNAAERTLRGIALGRKAWLFAGSDRGGERAAVMVTLIQTCRLNEVDPQAWLADVLAESPIIKPAIWPRCCRGVGCSRAPHRAA